MHCCPVAVSDVTLTLVMGAERSGWICAFVNCLHVALALLLAKAAPDASVLKAGIKLSALSAATPAMREFIFERSTGSFLRLDASTRDRPASSSTIVAARGCAPHQGNPYFLSMAVSLV
jgi:hypothetical protein